VVVLDAMRVMHRMRLEAAAVAEAPVLRLTWLFAMANRAENHEPKEDDYRIFRVPSDQDDVGIAPVAAAAVLSLHAEQKLPSYGYGCWFDVVKAAKTDVQPPEVRALLGDGCDVLVVAPMWQGEHIRGGLVMVGGQFSGAVTLRDIDRPLLSYRVELPKEPAAGWIRAGLLLRAAES